MLPIKLLLLALAFVCMLLAAFDVKAPRVHLGWLGLTLWILSELVR